MSWIYPKKPCYNEGNRIACKDSPLWSSKFTGVPITKTHIPCGYWFGGKAGESPIPHPWDNSAAIWPESAAVWLTSSDSDLWPTPISIFFCGGSLCYCPNQTICTNIGCSFPIIGIDLHWCDGLTISFSDNQICVTADGNPSKFCSIDVKMQIPPNDLGYPEGLIGYHSGIQLNECELCCDCTDISIGYTTQQMSINEEQTLTVTNAVEGCVYDWEVTSGGGSLSSPTGASVVYTASDENANCDQNPTISLSVEGNICDTLSVAINDYAYWTQAYRTFDYCECVGSPPQYLYCHVKVWTCWDEYCGPDTLVYWVDDNITCDDRCVNDCQANLPYDLRSAYHVSQGCCPAGLL